MSNMFDEAPRSFIPDKYGFTTPGAVKLSGMLICCGNCGRQFFTLYENSYQEREMMIRHITDYHRRCRSCGIEYDWEHFSFESEE